MKKVNEWLWKNAAQRAAVWMISAGLTRQRWLVRLLLVSMPSLVSLAASLEEIYRPSNSILWIFDPKGGDDLDDLLHEINEIVERAPTPFGHDEFVIVIERRASLPDDDDRLSFEQAEATLHQRSLVEQAVLRGNRWHDWKRGDSKQALREQLMKAVPTKSAPVTLIRAAVLGRSIARLAARFAGG